MGLWIKCPGCQANNPLYVKICSQCGLSLENLPPEKRLYVVGEAAALSAQPAASPAPARTAAKTAAKPAPKAEPAAKAAAKEEKKAKRPKKKKG